MDVVLISTLLHDSIICFNTVLLITPRLLTSRIGTSQLVQRTVHSTPYVLFCGPVYPDYVAKHWLLLLPSPSN